MKKDDCYRELTRREMLQISAASAAAFALPAFDATPAHLSAEKALYSSTLQSWCDGLLAHQLTTPDPALHGALLCPACALIHGRCGDAIYPLLRVAHTTGNPKYLQAALMVHDWSERNVSRPDGSWINDVTLSTWKGITVFRTIALAEALQHHGSLLPAATRQQWTARLAAAAKFLAGFITLQTGNINYPITATYAFALCASVLNETKYLDRAQKLAHEVLANFTTNGLIFGEGHPFDITTPKGCHPVDLGYNVEESLPALALYATLANDTVILERAITSLRAHLEFMLPDGGWDNSWGTRNYKWSYWGSRTSDGCQPAFMVLAGHSPQDAPRFREAARRNLELMHACTHNNLLYGGPDYCAHGDQPCIHHAFTHAKALATVLDRATFAPTPLLHPDLPRDQPYGVKSFPEIATHLVSIGEWRATVTAYDWEYVETVQAGSNAATGGGHASGGALAMLYHQQLGSILTASMNQYALVEISNQQQFLDKPHMTLTPRVETVVDGKTYTSLVDLEAKLTRSDFHDGVVLVAEGRLLTSSHQPLSDEDLGYQLTYLVNSAKVEITAKLYGSTTSPAHLIVPIIAKPNDKFAQSNPCSCMLMKSGGSLTINADATHGFEPIPADRTFNLVPGFECIPFSVALQPGVERRITLALFYNQ